MKRYLLSATLIFASLGAMAQQVINLWPNGAADDNGADNIAELTVYTPRPGVENTGKAVVICPGGGYEGLAIGHEGHEMAEILAAKGITGVVLKYRLPNGHHNIPADDAREAMRYVRRHAAEWGVDPEKIGISGFSAGGHLASTVLTHHVDSLSIPNFGLLFYPVVSVRPGITHDGSAIHLLGDKLGHANWVKLYSNDEQVNASTPPTMLLLSSDDTTVWVDNSLRFYKAMVDNNVPVEMHIFPTGNHGWGMHKEFKYHRQVIDNMLRWILSM